MKRRRFLQDIRRAWVSDERNLIAGPARASNGQQRIRGARLSVTRIPRVTEAAIGLGGFILRNPSFDNEAAAVRLIHEAIDRRVTFMDKWWDYNEGHSGV